MNWRTKLLLVVTVVVAVAGGVRWLGRSSEPASGQEGPATGTEVIQVCVSASGLRVIFTWDAWQPWDEAWLDLSLQDNGFIPGTFVGHGPVPATFNLGETDPALQFFAVVSWDGIEQGLVHYWRVNVRYGDAWYASPTYRFLSQVCAGAGAAPRATSGDASDLSGDVSELDRRLDKLEDCLDYYAPAGCSHRLSAMQDDLDDLEWRVEQRLKKLEQRVLDLEYGY